MSVDARRSAREQSNDADATSTAPPPLSSMRVPKGAIRHEDALAEIDVHAAVLKARRATEELEWQAQVKRAKEALTESEAVEWNALRARMRNAPVETTPANAKSKRPALLLARVPAAIEKRAADNVAAVHCDDLQLREAEEREWQELRARARLAEEREWAELIARARAATSRPLQRRARPLGRVVAWP
jgi:hypothetical protein